MAGEDAGIREPPFRFHHLERFSVPRRRHRHFDLREVWHHLGAADHQPAHLQRRGRVAGRGDVPLAGSARAAEGRKAARSRKANAPSLPENAFARRCASVLAAGKIRLHRPRRGVEHVQPSRQRQRVLVRGAERYAGTGRTADRAAARLRPHLFPRLDGEGRPPVLAVLGEYPDLGTSGACRTC